MEKELYLLRVFIEGYRDNNIISDTLPNFNNIKNLSFIFEYNGNSLICPKIKLGMVIFQIYFMVLIKKVFLK